MIHFISLIKKLIPQKIQRPVGRWRIENCNVSLNKKVDLSNEDHCGPCGQYALDSMKDSTKGIKDSTKGIKDSTKGINKDINKTIDILKKK